MNTTVVGPVGGCEIGAASFPEPPQPPTSTAQSKEMIRCLMSMSSLIILLPVGG